MQDAISNKFTEENMNPMRAGKHSPTIFRSSALAGGGHASQDSAHGEQLRMSASEEELEEFTSQELLAGLDDPRMSNSRASGMSDYFQEQADSGRPVNAVEEPAGREDGYDGYNGDSGDRSESLDYTDQGPGEGHKPVNHGIVGRLAFKQRVYVASLQQTARVYETEGGMVTVKTADGQFYEVPQSDIQVATNRPIMERTNPGQAQPGSADRPYNGKPRGRNKTDHPGISDVKDESDTLMNSFAEEDELPSGSYGERRRARRRE